MTNTNRIARLRSFRIDTLDAPQLNRLANAISTRKGGATLTCADTSWTFDDGANLAAYRASGK